MKVLSALVAVAVVVLAAPAPAGAHGAVTNPVSRLAACGTEGTSAGSAACKAALAGSGRQEWPDWDNLRLPGVGGRDRAVIPDGQLCSAGIDRYAGLDLPRTDWPVTRLTSGATFAFAYRTTIPHEGTFKLYVTRDGYDPKAPLAWSDLESKPFLSVEDPAVRDGAYRMTGKLPGGKSGRHLIYTIWQNSSTPDTYYSCSDVIFAAPATKAPAQAATATTKPAPKPAVAQAPSTTEAPPAAKANPEPASGTGALPLIGGGAAVVVLLGAVFAVLLHRKRGGSHRKPG